MLRCDQRGTAAVIETCLPDKYQPTGTKTALDLFAEDILKTTKLEYIVTNPEYRQTTYHSLSGDTLKIINYRTFCQRKKVDYENWPLYSNPWMEQAVNGRFLNVWRGKESRVYDLIGTL